MLKRWLPTGSVLAAAAALVLLLPATSSAQFRNRGFGLNVGNAGFYYGSGSPYYYGYYPGYSSGYYGGNTPYYGSTWYPRNYGFSPWTSRTWSEPSYSSSYDGSNPSYYSYSFPSGMAGSYHSSDMSTGYYGAPQGEMPRASEHTVLIDVRVPPNAEIWFEGTKTQQTGMFREFISPALEPAQDFTYHVRARWMENGQEVDKTRELRVRAGDQIAIDFLGEAAAGSAVPSTQPRGGAVPTRTGQGFERLPTYGTEQNPTRTGTETDRNLNRPGTERTPEKPSTDTTPSTPPSKTPEGR